MIGQQKCSKHNARHFHAFKLDILIILWAWIVCDVQSLIHVSGTDAHYIHVTYLSLGQALRKFMVKSVDNIPEYSQLSPCGHLAITDTPIIQIASKSLAKNRVRRLTEINSC